MSEAEEQLSQVIIKCHIFQENIPDPFFTDGPTSLNKPGHDSIPVNKPRSKLNYYLLITKLDRKLSHCIQINFFVIIFIDFWFIFRL